MDSRKHLCVLVLVGTAVWTAAGSGLHGQPQFRSGVDLVRLDIRVVDAIGRPITDLRPEEVVITEDGVERPALLFQRVTEPAETFVDAARKAMTAEVTSNEAFPRGHLYVLVFDQAHIAAGNEQRARLAAEQFIRSRVRPADRVAVYAVPGPGPRLGFTSDRSRAIAELGSVRGSYQRVVSTPFGTFPIYDAHRIVLGDERLIIATFERLTREGTADLLGLASTSATAGRGGGAGEDSSVARRLLVENARTIINQSDAESRQFLQRLAELVRNLADIEGRKSVVLFSEGFFQDNLARELETVAAAAAQTYSVFYTIDLNQRGPVITEAYASDTVQGSEIQARIAPLGTLAAETDGEFVVDASARSGDVLTRLAAQAQDYYLVGFEPSAKAREQRGQYQRVSVRVTRPGARVSTRTGYSLRPDQTPADRQRALSNVLNAPFVQQGLKVDYTTYLLKSDVPGLQRVIMSLSARLPVRQTEADRADVLFVARDARDGRVVATGTDTVPLPAASTPETRMGQAPWRVQFSLPAGAYQLRVVVREPGGLIGSADRRLDVRALDTPDLSVSDLVLGPSPAAVPVRASAYVVDGLAGIIEVYARTRPPLEGLSLAITLRQPDGREVVASTNQPFMAPFIDGTGFLSRAPFTMSLAGVAPGAYLAHATLSSASATIAERTRFVDVVPGSAGSAIAAWANPTPAPIAPVTARGIVEGQLGQTYVSSILAAASGTAWEAAAGDAARGEWERAEAAVLAGSASDKAFVPNAILGLSRFVREQFVGAAAALTLARQADEGSAMTAFFLGWAHDFAGDTRAALTAWRGAAFLEPTMVSVHLALADGYLKLREPALAAQALRAGLQVLPDSAALRARLREIEGK